MYLSLKTEFVWKIVGEIPPSEFLKNLYLLLSGNDVMSLGSYDPNAEVRRVLTKIDIELSRDLRPYSDSFHLNYGDYPNGRSYDLPFHVDNISELERLSLLEDGGTDKQLFFDHFVAFRQSNPMVPLINYHDAFTGGNLYFSGLFCDQVVGKYCEAVGVEAVSVINPEVLQET